jgi:hypothetical protein
VGEALAPVEVALRGLGFRRRATGILTIEVSADVLGWVGLNTAHRSSGSYFVNPVVGVRHQLVERIVAEHRGDVFHPYSPPTVSRPLRLLLEDHAVKWVVGADSEPGYVDRLVHDLDDVGSAYIDARSTLDGLLAALVGGEGFEHQLRFRRPVALALLGDRRAAAALVADELRALAEATDPASVDLAGFLRRFNDSPTMAPLEW